MIGMAACNWTVSNSGASANWVGEGDDISLTNEGGNDDRTKMTLSRGIARSVFGVTHTELAQARSSIHASTLITDLWGESYLSSLATLIRKIEVAVFKGTGTETSPSSVSVNGIVGLLNALKTSGTYAGQNVASFSGLQSNVQTGVGSLAVSNLDKGFSQMLKASDTTPDFMMGSPATGVALKNAIVSPGSTGSILRLEQVGNQVPQYNAGTGTAPTQDVPVLFYNGVPFLPNPAWDDGYLFAGRMEDFVLDILPYQSIEPAEGVVAGVASNGRTVENVGVPIFTYYKGKTGSSYVAAMEVELQLICKRPNASFWLQGITTT